MVLPADEKKFSTFLRSVFMDKTTFSQLLKNLKNDTTGFKETRPAVLGKCATQLLSQAAGMRMNSKSRPTYLRPTTTSWNRNRSEFDDDLLRQEPCRGEIEQKMNLIKP